MSVVSVLRLKQRKYCKIVVNEAPLEGIDIRAL